MCAPQTTVEAQFQIKPQKAESRTVLLKHVERLDQSSPREHAEDKLTHSHMQ